MSEPADEFEALQSIIRALQPLSSQDRERVLSSAATFLQISTLGVGTRSADAPKQGVSERNIPQQLGHAGYPEFSTSDTISPKDFLFEKQPRSDVERIAVLAFYLTHYRDTPHFKTLDLSKLNTEAAQPKFANAASSAGNAVKQGYLVPSTKDTRQISAAGERYVAALPDRDAARSTMASVKPRKRSQRRSPAVESDAK